jgi:hypothetical protein
VQSPNPVKQKKELPKSSMLGSIKKNLHTEVVKEITEEKVALTEENLQVLWKGFLTENKAKLQNAFLSVAERQVPVLSEDKIIFVEENNVSLEMLQLHKVDIVSYFLRKCTLQQIPLEFKINKSEEIEKSYKTKKDRLRDMISTNAAVLKLIEKFNLDLE